MPFIPLTPGIFIMRLRIFLLLLPLNCLNIFCIWRYWESSRLMLVCALMTSISIVREKERGTMEVLLVSPMKPLMIIIAKAVPYLVLAFVILTVILLMAKFVLGVPLAGSLVWIILISTIYILLALSLGLLVSNVAKTQLVALLVCAMVRSEERRVGKEC